VNRIGPAMRGALLAACAGVLLSVAPAASWAQGAAVNPKWAGKGACRMLVKVLPKDIGKRASDEMPARMQIAADKLPFGMDRLDVDSIQVIRYDPATGEPMPSARFAYGLASSTFRSGGMTPSFPIPFPKWRGTPTKTRRSGATACPVGVSLQHRGRLAGGHVGDAPAGGQQPFLLCNLFRSNAPGETN